MIDFTLALQYPAYRLQRPVISITCPVLSPQKTANAYQNLDINRN